AVEHPPDGCAIDRALGRDDGAGDSAHGFFLLLRARVRLPGATPRLGAGRRRAHCTGPHVSEVPAELRVLHAELLGDAVDGERGAHAAAAGAAHPREALAVAREDG